jgi:hypothetical protein
LLATKTNNGKEPHRPEEEKTMHTTEKQTHTSENYVTGLSRAEAPSGLVERVVLPLPPLGDQRGGDETKFEMDIYVRFMRHLRQVPNSRLEIKILSAIQFIADLLDHGDALVAKTLVDMGLRAPRRAFPVSFLDFVDRSMARQSWEHGNCPPASVASLQHHWNRIGEDPFTASLRPHYAIFNGGQYASA